MRSHQFNQNLLLTNLLIELFTVPKIISIKLNMYIDTELLLKIHLVTMITLKSEVLYILISKKKSGKNLTICNMINEFQFHVGS